MKRKYLSILLIAVMAVFGLTACGQNLSKNPSGNGKIKVVVTIFPEYDWVKQIAGERASDMDITMLLDNGVDLHSYQPTAADIMKISDCDLFIYVGGESDTWVDDALKEAVNKNMKVINLLDVLGDSVKEEEVVEGMQAEEEEKSGEEEEEPEYDEHVWLSLKNAKVLCKAIADNLSEIDLEHKAVYDANVSSYIGKLDELDAQYKSAVESFSKKTILFGDRFPFRYLVDDYNLDYYAAFAGCSAETEASFKTVTFLAGKVDETGTKAILTIDGSDEKLAMTIKDNTKDKNQEILQMDSMQSVKISESEDYNYINVMLKNLTVLKQALS